ncbi:hypothetical protein OROMI_024660 [Orobanche minor]
MGDGVVLAEGANYNSGVGQSLIFLYYGVAQKRSSITQKSRNPYPNPAFFHFLSDCPTSKGPPTTARRLYAIATVDCIRFSQAIMLPPPYRLPLKPSGCKKEMVMPLV